MSRRIIVVGAGVTGLAVASELARRGPVLVVDRIPVVGGVAGWNGPHVRALAAAAARAGVGFELGATATRWADRALLVCAPHSISWRPAALLVIATGWRPATAVELGLAGDRPAGVLPITVARHLLDAGLPLWRRPAIVGGDLDADEVAHLLAGHGVPLTGVCSQAAWADASLADWRPHEVEGRARVERLILARGDERRAVRCDAVLLAAAPRPTRNIDGAIASDAPGVAFVDGDPRLDVVAATEHAARAGRALAASLDEVAA